MRATFPASARLHRPSEYALALKGRRIARGALFVVMTPRENPPPGHTARLGMIIAKRFASKATSRNSIKRIIRESFRLRRCALPAGDFVFRLHSPIGQVSLTELKSRVRIEVNALLERASR